MKVLLQRVTMASVSINGEVVGRIDGGLLALVGIGHGDGQNEVKWLAEKMCCLRIFEDEDAKMNRSLVDTGGGALIVSQFTLLADCRNGRRPAFTDAAHPAHAKQLYETFVEEVRQRDVHVQTGIFAASMQVALVNDGPVTILLERTSNGGSS